MTPINSVFTSCSNQEADSDRSTWEAFVDDVVKQVRLFYQNHPEIKTSHGWDHVEKVYYHTTQALSYAKKPLEPCTVMAIKMASLLHDVDDTKYFPDTPMGQYPNAVSILQEADVPEDNQHAIVRMISWVSCSGNGNSVPTQVAHQGDYHLLIPRWADRLEAVGARGVIRCYQYNQEKKRPLSSEHSPRPQTEKELWEKYARPDKLQAYMDRGGSSTDMISHYYDKLLLVARPPREAVQNAYLERMADKSSKELVEVCLRFGRTGKVDEDYILGLGACAVSNNQIPGKDPSFRRACTNRSSDSRCVIYR